MIKLNLKVVTAQDVIDSQASEYNPWEWKRIVYRYMEYDDVQFYRVNDKERFAVLYTVDGVRFFARIKYGGSLTACDPFVVHIEPANEQHVSVSDAILRNDTASWKMHEGRFVAHIDTDLRIPDHLRKKANYILTKDTLW